MAAKQTSDVRAQTLDVATELFARNGYDATSLSAIAQLVGVRKPSLLYHFPSKEALRQAVLARVLSHWSEVLPEILAQATTGGRRFRALADAVCQFFVDDPNRARLLLREMLDRPEEMKLLLSEYVSPWVGVLQDYILDGQRAGTVWPDLDPHAYLLHVIHNMVAGIATADVFTSLYTSNTSARARMDRHVAELLRMAHAGLFLPHT